MPIVGLFYVYYNAGNLKFLLGAASIQVCLWWECGGRV